MRVEGGGATLAFTSETPIIVKRLCSRYFAPPFSIPFPLAPYIHPLPRSRLPSPSRASASLTDSPGPSIPSKWIPIHRDATKMVKHEHSLLPYRFGERDLNVLLRNWRRLGVGMEGRNCRQPSACLPASSTTLLHPIPSPYPTFYIPEALIQTRFVNIDVRSALRSCKFSLSPFYPFLMPSLSIFAFVPTSFFPLDRRLARLLHSDLPRGNRSWSDGSFSLTRITGEVSLPGSRRVINSFGSPSSASYPTLPQRIPRVTTPSRVERGLMINSKDPDRIYVRSSWWNSWPVKGRGWRWGERHERTSLGF